MTIARIAACLIALATGPAAAFDLQGHRGARGLMPENTLEGFRAALAIGVTTLELDIGMTRDGVLVVHHDQALNPGIARDGKGAYVEKDRKVLRRMTLADLRAYEVGRLKPGHDYGLAFPTQKQIEGVRIPTLDAVLALAKRPGAEAIRFNIETKLSPMPNNTAPEPRVFARALADLVKKHGLESRVSVQSFDWRTLVAMKEIAPAIERVCLSSEGQYDTLQRGKPGASPWTAGIDIDAHGGDPGRLVKAAGCAVWSPNFRNLTQEAVAAAQALGLKVVPWTVNEPFLMKRMLDWKVDGLITDFPDKARAVMAERKMPLPKPVE
jgi:glycerophosphoryl diester phosphodiesterase